MLANKAVKVFVSIELSMIVETDNKQVNRKMNVTLQCVIWAMKETGRSMSDDRVDRESLSEKVTLSWDLHVRMAQTRSDDKL